MAGYVTGAAILGGELVLSLSDGQIINCGLVRGSRGEKGVPGAPGPQGKPGIDGNGMLHGSGAPRADEGTDGDFFIDTSNLHLYGPKTASGWGAAAYLRPDDQGRKAANGQRYNEQTLARNRVFGRNSLLVGGGPPSVVSSSNGDGLDRINGFGTPLAANTSRMIAGDVKGDVMHVLVFGQAATGSLYLEVIATRDGNGNTGETIAWETPLGATPPVLDFQASVNASNVLELSITSDIALTELRGKVIYV